MEECRDEDGRNPDSRIEFMRTLSELKRDGSMLLVVGAVPDEIHTSACHRMLGHDRESRRRLFVETDAVCADVVERVPINGPEHPAEAVRRIRNPAYARSASVQTSVSPAIPETCLEKANLFELGVMIANEIERFERASGGLDPSELRLCFDSLVPVVDEHDHELVFRFLHILSGLVRDAQGQAHFHLPVDPTSPIVATIAPLFDAVVELGVDRGRPRQRWHLKTIDLTSEWLPL